MTELPEETKALLRVLLKEIGFRQLIIELAKLADELEENGFERRSRLIAESMDINERRHGRVK